MDIVVVSLAPGRKKTSPTMSSLVTVGFPTPKRTLSLEGRIESTISA